MCVKLNSHNRLMAPKADLEKSFTYYIAGNLGIIVALTGIMPRLVE